MPPKPNSISVMPPSRRKWCASFARQWIGGEEEEEKEGEASFEDTAAAAASGAAVASPRSGEQRRLFEISSLSLPERRTQIERSRPDLFPFLGGSLTAFVQQSAKQDAVARNNGVSGRHFRGFVVSE